jgi:phage repressor protein C with HTH and peptisase S24 domain
MELFSTEEIVGRIKELIIFEGYNQKQFSEKIDFHYSNLVQILKGERKVNQNLIGKILAAFPGLRSEWLINGEGEKYESEEIGKRTSALYDEMSKEVTKPRLPITAAAGVLSEYLEGVKMYECEQIPIIRSIPEYDFTMIVKGNSMEPKFESGDEIACKKVEKIIEWGRTYVLATRDGAVLKRLYQDEDGVRCVSYNHEEYPDFHVDGDDILGVYRVVGLLRV